MSGIRVYLWLIYAFRALVCLVYQEPDAAARIAAQTVAIQIVVIPNAEGLIVVIPIVAIRIAAIQNAAIRNAAIRNAAIRNAVRVGIRVAPILAPQAAPILALHEVRNVAVIQAPIRVATPIVGPVPLARDVRGVEFHAAVPKPAQLVRCVARAYWTAEHSRSFPDAGRVSPILPASFGLTYPTCLAYPTGRERPQSEADQESQVVPVAARGFAAAEAQAEL